MVPIIMRGLAMEKHFPKALTAILMALQA